MTYLEAHLFCKNYIEGGAVVAMVSSVLCVQKGPLRAEGSLNLSERPRCTKDAPDSKITMESKLTTTTVKHYGDGTQEASILGEQGGPSLVGTPSGASKSENPGSFSSYDIPSGIYRTSIAAQFRVGNGHLQSGLGKSWDNTERKSDRLLQRALRNQKCF